MSVASFANIFSHSEGCLCDDVLRGIDFDGTRYIWGDMLLDQGQKGQLKRIFIYAAKKYDYDSLRYELSTFKHRWIIFMMV